MKRDGQRSRKSRVGHAPQQGSVGATRSATMNSQSGGGESMRVTVSVIKADIGAIGGHTIPSADVLAVVRDRVSRERGGLLIDGFVYHTGDDIALLMTHTRGKDHPAVHQLAWDAFRAATDVAKRQGLYGAGQDLLKDAFSSNVRGLGPGSAEVEFDERPNEALMILTADKTEPGAFNLPMYLIFADPMYSSGLLLSEALQAGRIHRIGKDEIRSEEHTSELQSHSDLVCRLLLEKKK